ncbi:hypothetical protein [Streptomyces sp. NRRL S-350]|uniref:hypothetical protein n=1 Tax=Streptomyces sp. NRRL S-350 TaxID=1463902 RepID=UPI0004C0BEC3|nr:hypothetical protein [Streptomyces sp. NRRL S-350]
MADLVMAAPNRDGLDRLVGILTARLGPFLDDDAHPRLLTPALRSVRHAVIGVDAYLVAVQSGSPAAAHLAAQAEGLWQSLVEVAASWPDPPPPAPGSGSGGAVQAAVGPAE